jgi:hypothetical protein
MRNDKNGDYSSCSERLLMDGGEVLNNQDNTDPDTVRRKLSKVLHWSTDGHFTYTYKPQNRGRPFHLYLPHSWSATNHVL